jgi:hypothetical protein
VQSAQPTATGTGATAAAGGPAQTWQQTQTQQDATFIEGLHCGHLLALSAGASKKRSQQQQEQEQGGKLKHGSKHKHRHGKKHHHHHDKKHKAADGKDDRPHYGDMTGPQEQDVWQSDDSDKACSCHRYLAELLE